MSNIRKSGRNRPKLDYKNFNSHGFPSHIDLDLNSPVPLETPRSRRQSMQSVVTNTSLGNCLTTPRNLNSTMSRSSDQNSLINSAKSGMLGASLIAGSTGSGSPKHPHEEDELALHAGGDDFPSDSDSDSEVQGAVGGDTTSGGQTEEEIEMYEKEIQRMTMLKKQKRKHEKRNKLAGLKEKYQRLKAEMGDETSDEELSASIKSRETKSKHRHSEEKHVRFQDSGLKSTSGPDDLRRVLNMNASRKEAQRAARARPNLKVTVEQGSSSSEEEEDLMLKGERLSLKSGMLGKAQDKVESPQMWPQVAIAQGATLGKSMNFKDLDIKWFMVGELEIISSGRITEIEKAGRLFLLKQLLYLSNGSNTETLKQIYSTIVGKIERGLLAWEQYGNTFQHEIQWCLTWLKIEPKTGGSVKSKRNKKLDGIFWCRDYNQGKCNKKDKHFGTMYDSQVTFHHICAKCFIADKSRNPHPETSCPHSTNPNPTQE